MLSLPPIIFFLLFFLHLGLSSFFFFFSFFLFFFCIFLRWHFNNFVKLHNRHIGWIYIWEIVKLPRLDYGHDSWYIYINTLFFLLDKSRIIHHNRSSILSIKTIPSMNAAMKFLWNDKQPLIFLPNLNIDFFIKKIRFELNPPMLLYPRVYMGTTFAFKKLNK